MSPVEKTVFKESDSTIRIFFYIMINKLNLPKDFEKKVTLTMKSKIDKPSVNQRKLNEFFSMTNLKVISSSKVHSQYVLFANETL